MRNHVLALTAVLTALFAVACADPPFDPDDPRLDGAQLVIVGSSAHTLQYGQMATLRVRYDGADGSPIESAPLSYELIGDGAGSRLGAFETVTDAAGEAEMLLTAGGANAMFGVRVSPPAGGGDPLEFSVAVSDTEAGSIVVSMTYPGMRDLVRFDTFLFDAEPCTALDPMSLPTATRSAPSVSTVTAMPGFAGVRVGDRWTVAVVARNGSAVAAFGCRDNIAVTNGNETPVNITLMDTEIAPSFVGVFDLDNRFDFGGALPDSVETALDILSEIGDDSAIDGEFGIVEDPDGDGVWPEFGQDPGAFVVDLAMRETCAWKCLPGEETFESCSRVDHPLGDIAFVYTNDLTSDRTPAESAFFGGCGMWEFFHIDAQNLVNNQVFGRLPDFMTDWIELASDLARAITNAHILSVLTINQASAGNEFDLPMSHELVQMVVDFRNPLSDPPGATVTRTFSLAEAGFSTLMVDEVTTVTGTTLNIPEHSFAMNWGELTLYIYRQVLLNEIFGVTSTGALFAQWVECADTDGDGMSFATRLDQILRDNFAGRSPGVPALENYCTTALSLAGTVLEDQLGELLDVDGTLTISGTATGADIDESTGRVDTLTNGMWIGSFSDMASTGDVTATFTGARRSGG